MGCRDSCQHRDEHQQADHLFLLGRFYVEETSYYNANVERGMWNVEDSRLSPGSSTAWSRSPLLESMQDISPIKPPENLANRTRRFAVAVVRFYVGLPKSNVYFTLGRQLLRCGTSAGAQYREARRAKSNADFISKMEGALQELDETTYWLEVLDEAGLARGREVEKLAAEANELISIFVSIIRRSRDIVTNVI